MIPGSIPTRELALSWVFSPKQPVAILHVLPGKVQRKWRPRGPGTMVCGFFARCLIASRTLRNLDSESRLWVLRFRKKNTLCVWICTHNQKICYVHNIHILCVCAVWRFLVEIFRVFLMSQLVGLANRLRRLAATMSCSPGVPCFLNISRISYHPA